VIKKFQLFRLTLLEKNQGNLFGSPKQTREEYLREIFSKAWDFTKYSSTFHYVPANNRSTSKNGAGLLVGRIGRPITLPENKPPADGFIEQNRDTWKAEYLIVDPRNYSDGQKVAIQIDPQVGDPKSVFNGLIKHINETDSGSRFSVEAQPIFDPTTFWDFAKTNKGKITTLTFEFTAPNGLFSSNESIADDLKEARNKINANKVISTFKNKEGLNTDSQPVKDGVEYAQTGSGEIRARTIDNKRYSSIFRPVFIVVKNSDQAITLDFIETHSSLILGRMGNDE
jgi:hypothetical protein